MKNQCFGGDYMGEVFDHMLKRMSYRRQKRWWNAYILFYRRVDSMEINNTITRSLNELTLCKCISLFIFCIFYRYMFAIKKKITMLENNSILLIDFIYFNITIVLFQ